MARASGSKARPLEGLASSIPWDFNVDLGTNLRKPSEGMDLLAHVFQDLAEKPMGLGWETVDGTLKRVLGRGLDNVMVDLHSAAVLKDYADRLDWKTDPRWRLEWIGNVNAGQPMEDQNGDGLADPEFPDHPPTSTIAQLKASDPDAQIPGAYAVRHGNVHETGCSNHMPDDLRRARRMQDDFEPASAPPSHIPPDTWWRSPATEVQMSEGETLMGSVPYLSQGAMAVLSVHPAMTDHPWTFRLQVSSILHRPRLRVFTVNGNGVPSLLSTCRKSPEGPLPAPVDLCEWEDTGGCPPWADINTPTPCVEGRDFDETLAVPAMTSQTGRQKREVIAIVSGPGAFGWKMSSVTPMVTQVALTGAFRTIIGQPNAEGGRA